MAESQYSQLDREATAIYWSFKRFYQYLFGRKFTLIIDNRPLFHIFNPNKSMPIMSTHRLLRYSQFITGFNYEIKHRASKQHGNIDYLSRNPITLNTNLEEFKEESYLINQIQINIISNNDPITSEHIRTETNKDIELNEMKRKLLNGEIMNAEYSVHSGVILRGILVVIPKALRPAILKELHSTVKMKSIARSLCYWPKIDEDIENMVKSCQDCSKVKKNPAKMPIHMVRNYHV